MSRYYFDLHNGEGPTRDEIGIDLPSRNQVSKEASRILLDLARDEISVVDRAVITVTVRSENGEPISVANLTFNNEWLSK